MAGKGGSGLGRWRQMVSGGTCPYSILTIDGLTDWHTTMEGEYGILCLSARWLIVQLGGQAYSFETGFVWATISSTSSTTLSAHP